MATLSHEFADLVHQLHNSPDSHSLKKTVLKHLPEIKALAQHQPMALYHLAYVYSPNSSQFKKIIEQAAHLGCTNAMLVMCQILKKSNRPTDLEKIVYYLSKIEQSNDSYMKEQARKEYPQLIKMLQQKHVNSIYPCSACFFTAQQEKGVVDALHPTNPRCLHFAFSD